jgi:hypothetical protein
LCSTHLMSLWLKLHSICVCETLAKGV